MSYALRHVILGTESAERWPALEDALQLLGLVSDIVVFARERWVEAVSRTEPPRQVHFSMVDAHDTSCSCGENSRARPCPHYVAARLVWEHERDEDGEIEILRRRTSAIAALGAARAALVDTYLALDDAGDPMGLEDLLWDHPGPEAAMEHARAMVGRATEEQLSRFLLGAIEVPLGTARQAPRREELRTAIVLGEHLSRSVDPRAPSANAPALMEIYGRLRRAFTDDDVSSGELLASFHAVCRTLGTLVSAGEIATEPFRRALLEDELASPPLDFPLLGRVAVLLDPTGERLFRPLTEELEECAGQMPASSAKSEDACAVDAGRVPTPRLRAEIAYAGGASDSLLDALESWPAAPYGEFLARASRRKSLTFRLAIAEAARRTDRLRWVGESGGTTWSPGVRGEHLHLSDIPLTRDPRIEHALLRRIHQDLPGDPAWAHVAVGDLAGLMTDL
ncbi:MAG: hypothetical protein ACTHX2_13350, partial [Microbacterium sp.]